MILLLVGAIYFTFFHQDTAQGAEMDRFTIQSDTPIEKKLLFIRHYVDGERSEETRTVTSQIEEIRSDYREWNIVDETEKEIVLERFENDISPLLKNNGYFGVTEAGVLTIYNGDPSNQEIIQSFFQINIDGMESRLLQKLQKGIPIKSKDCYQEVLKVYEPFSKEEW